MNKDPLFTGYTSGDFTLKSNSPAKDAGGALTKVSASDFGGGTRLTVDDAGFFQDGWAGVAPDWIAVGTSGNAAHIASIDYANNIITLASPLSRGSGDPVWLYKDSSGRHERYGSAPEN